MINKLFMFPVFIFLINSVLFSMDDNICAAVIHRNLARVQAILHVNPHAVHARWDVLRDSPLHIAVQIGNEAIARLLLEHRADVDARNRIIRDTPLHIAVQIGNEAIARLLLEHRADIDARNFDEDSPLDIAIEDGHEAMAQLLRDWPMYRAYMSHHVPLPSDQALAFLQAMHPRLGAAFPIRNLPSYLIRHITEIATHHTLDEIHQMAEQERALERERGRRNQALTCWLEGGAAAAAVATIGVFAYRAFKRR